MKENRQNTELWKWYVDRHAEDGDRAPTPPDHALEAWLNDPLTLGRLADDMAIDSLLRFDNLDPSRHERFVQRCRHEFERVTSADRAAMPSAEHETVLFPPIRSERYRPRASNRRQQRRARRFRAWIVVGTMAASIAIGLWYFRGRLLSRSAKTSIARHTDPAGDIEHPEPSTRPIGPPGPSRPAAMRDSAADPRPGERVVEPPIDRLPKTRTPDSALTVSNDKTNPTTNAASGDGTRQADARGQQPIQPTGANENVPRAVSQPAAIAQLTFRAAEEPDQRREREPQTLRSGQSIDIREGRGEIVFASGTHLFFQAPLMATLVSADQIRLERGRVLVEVASRGAAFTVVAGKHRWRSVRAKYQIHLADPPVWETFVTVGHVTLTDLAESTDHPSSEGEIELSKRELNQAAAVPSTDERTPTVLIARGKDRFLGQIGIHDDLFQTGSPEQFFQVVRNVRPLLHRMDEPELVVQWRAFVARWHELVERANPSGQNPLPFEPPFALSESAVETFEFDLKKMGDDWRNGATYFQGLLDFGEYRLEFTSPDEFHRFRRQVRK